jgi:putative hemolysin
MNEKSNINDIIDFKLPKSWYFNNPFVKRLITKIFRRILYLETINNFLSSHSHLDERQFVHEIFDYLNFSFTISDRDSHKIPSEGRVICVSNHPIGSLDSLSVMKAFLDVRRDVKIVANDFLYSIKNLRPLFIPFKLDTSFSQKTSILEIQKALEDDKAVIFFPAASVSRLKGIKIVDAPWHKGAVHFARKTHSPILPIFINGKNSFLFYAVSIISKKFSTYLLAHELFNKKNKSIEIKVGDIIPSKVFTQATIEENYQTKLLRKHSYLIGKNKKGIFITEKNVIRPSDRRLLRAELNKAELLGNTKEGMKIFLTTKRQSPEILNEIARLREITFRKVGEGTGKKFDLDKYDEYYKHLIVWDDNELEIVGAYRIGIGIELLQKFGEPGFYTSSLFKFSHKFVNEYLHQSIELGRSFVQKKYWNTNALNYLWQGIGTFLYHNPSVKYMFGGVSISNNYSNSAQECIIYYFKKWYPSIQNLAESKRKFIVSEKSKSELEMIFKGKSAKEDYKILKKLLIPLGCTVPILYKHYSELSDSGGVKFLDFGVDPEFENCTDGLILVTINLISDEKRQKFMSSSFNADYKATA